ncbi:MAG: response regulator transcription factor [Pseudomonadota bacterium]
MPHILIADDHPLVRGAVRQAVTSAFPGARCAEADSLSKIESLLRGGDLPDLLLLDLHMPGVEGFSGLLHLRTRFPDLPIAIVSAQEEPTVMRMSIQHGALGFLPKSASVDTIKLAITKILNGEIWAPPAAFEAASLDGTQPADDLSKKMSRLTPQQVRVLGMLGEGKLNKQIAHELGISEATVKAHVSAILAKLEVDNRTQAVITAAPLLNPPQSASVASLAN